MSTTRSRKGWATLCMVLIGRISSGFWFERPCEPTQAALKRATFRALAIGYGETERADGQVGAARYAMPAIFSSQIFLVNSWSFRIRKARYSSSSLVIV